LRAADLADALSRYLLHCQALARCDAGHVWSMLDAAFREFDRPLRLRSDNGSPFASIRFGGLSRLSVLVIQAGVEPERIAPGKPQQNGRHERMHLTLSTPPPRRRPTACEQLDRLRAFWRLHRRTFHVSIMRSARARRSATPLPPNTIISRPAPDASRRNARRRSALATVSRGTARRCVVALFVGHRVPPSVVAKGPWLRASTACSKFIRLLTWE
jgi:hypothetical protein